MKEEISKSTEGDQERQIQVEDSIFSFVEAEDGADEHSCQECEAPREAHQG